MCGKPPGRLSRARNRSGSCQQATNSRNPNPNSNSNPNPNANHGNLIDRVARGYVVDFIHVTHWPVFNVADVALVVGFGLLFVRPRERREARG